MAGGSINNAHNPPPFHEGMLHGRTTVISERDRIVLRRNARARRAASMQRPRRTTLAFGITQVILGFAIVAVSFTAFALSTSNRIRNACPYWAGFSVLFTGGVGLIAWKQPSSLAISFFTFLSALCVILHLVATALSGLSCAELQLFTQCRPLGSRVCYCCTSTHDCEPSDNSISVEGVRDCTMIQSTIRLVMFIICVANIVACLVCIAATIVGCAYIVKRHSARRMLLRRPHHTGHIARDSYISDLGGVIDPIFTPPLVPPPPYSPPEYTEISNDPVIVEAPDFLDDLSTPTPVMPVAPHELPPPYSTINILPGATIECSVAQEFQMAQDEIRDPYDNRLHETADGCLGEGYIPAGQPQETPLPPLRWDSHNITINFTEGVGVRSSLTLPNGDVGNRCSSSERRRRRMRRRRSPSDNRSGDSDQAARRHSRSRPASETLSLPLAEGSAMGMHAPDRTSACLDERRHQDRIVTASSCERVGTNREETMLEPLQNRNTSMHSERRTGEITNGNIDPTMDCHNNADRNSLEENLSIRVCNGNESLRGNHKRSNFSNSSSPSQSNSIPSENSPSGSSERLTGGTGSSSSRNTRRSSSAQRRQRRRRSSDRRMRTSSSNYSTSSTDHSSKSNGGIRQTARARQQQLFSTSSSSDSEDNTPQRPRRLVAKMVNGTVTHEIERHGQNGQSSGPSRSRRHTRGSRNRQRPVSAQPTVGRQSIPQSQGSINSKVHARPGMYHDRVVTCHGLSPSSIQFNQQGRVKQRRPDSLDLKLIWSSHRGYIGQSSLSTSSSADSYDPWIPREGAIPADDEKLTVNLSVGEAATQKMSEAAPSCIKKKQLHRMSESKNLPKNILSSALQQPNNDSHNIIIPDSENSPIGDLGLPHSNIKRVHITPEKDIDTTECCNFTDSSPRDRPRSMVDFNKDTSILVSEILSHADADISPAVKTVLKDIHSVIANDDRYLSEIWQSACILEKLSSKCSRQRNRGQNGIVHFKDNREKETVETPVSKAEQMKFRHSCPDVDDMQRQAEKMMNVSRADLVKGLEGARETVL